MIRLENLDLLISQYISQAGLAAALGETPGYISQLKNKRRPINEKTARKIETKLELPSGWMDDQHQPTAATLHPDASKKDEPIPAAHRNVQPGPETKGLIPLISWVAAGAWTAVEDPYEVGDAEKWMPCPVAHGNHTFALRVRGSSMEDEYRDGDIIYIDPSRRPENGSHIVVRLDDSEEATFKRLVMEGGDTYLEALNKSWPERVIKVNGNATIIGVVVFSGRER